MKLLLVGSTGLVGRNVLEAALSDSRVSSVVAPVRRALKEQPKLLAPVVDFEKLPEDADWWRADAVICTLGTTIKVAGSREAFRRVDYEFPLAVAKIARAHGTPAYVLNSALGANPDSRVFYSRVKGELERDLAGIGFNSLTLVRPGVISGDRDEFRIGERVALAVLTVASSIIPRSWRPNPAKSIARAMVNAALLGEAGVHAITAGAEELV